LSRDEAAAESTVPYIQYARRILVYLS